MKRKKCKVQEEDDQLTGETDSSAENESVNVHAVSPSAATWYDYAKQQAIMQLKC